MFFSITTAYSCTRSVSTNINQQTIYHVKSYHPSLVYRKVVSCISFLSVRFLKSQCSIYCCAIELIHIQFRNDHQIQQDKDKYWQRIQHKQLPLYRPLFRFVRLSLEPFSQQQLLWKYKSDDKWEHVSQNLLPKNLSTVRIDRHSLAQQKRPSLG